MAAITPHLQSILRGLAGEGGVTLHMKPHESGNEANWDFASSQENEVALVLCCCVFESVLKGISPCAAGGVNRDCDQSDQAGDYRILEGFHSTLIVKKLLYRLHSACSF